MTDTPETGVVLCYYSGTNGQEWDIGWYRTTEAAHRAWDELVACKLLPLPPLAADHPDFLRALSAARWYYTGPGAIPVQTKEKSKA